ncbi:hypothetical protein ABZP36_002104 [Zizania latifolia]
MSLANSDLPAPFFDLEQLISSFGSKGFTATDMVALSGVGCGRGTRLMVLVAAMAAAATAQLSATFYDTSCPNALSTIQSAVTAAVNNEPRMGASLLRLHFHDCFLGGPSWTVLLGRRDSTTASKSNADNDLPAPSFDLVNLTTAFSNKGLSTADMVALSAQKRRLALLDFVFGSIHSVCKRTALLAAPSAGPRGEQQNRHGRLVPLPHAHLPPASPPGGDPARKLPAAAAGLAAFPAIGSSQPLECRKPEAREGTEEAYHLGEPLALFLRLVFFFQSRCCFSVCRRMIFPLPVTRNRFSDALRQAQIPH